MVIRMLKELSGNYNSMKKDIETMNKNQLEMKDAISEMLNILERIKSILHEVEDQIIKLLTKIEKNAESQQKYLKRLK